MQPLNGTRTATGGTAVFTGPVFTTPVLNATATYYAEAGRTADGCTQAVRKPATVTVTPVPAAPVVANASVTVCSGQPATFTAQAVTGVTYSWYSAATGGTPVFTGNPFTTPALTATTSYYVEAAGAGQCLSATRTQVIANVTATPCNTNGCTDNGAGLFRVFRYFDCHIRAGRSNL